MTLHFLIAVENNVEGVHKCHRFYLLACAATYFIARWCMKSLEHVLCSTRTKRKGAFFPS